MALPNDERIAALRTKIAAKRAALAGRSARFAPVTNCSLELDGTRYNLHSLGLESLIFLAAKLQALRTGAVDLAFAPTDLVIGGFGVDDWITDVKARLAVVAFKAEEAQLNALDKQLEGLLSSDAKTELALDSIDALLA